jgi:peroxin-1
VSKSAYVGWTGTQSQRRLASVVGREGLSGRRGTNVDEREVPLIEIDASFARTLGLSEGQKVGAIIHLDPPLAHTVNIEPLTPEDWEIIETKANYLELNLLAQIRALPNPNYEKPGNNHPLTLHITNTLHATIKITSLLPVPASNVAFVKLAPDAEVIVAPKTRARSRSRVDTKSVGKRSVGGRSTTSTVRHKKEEVGRTALFLRGVERQVAHVDGNEPDVGLRIWLDRDDVLSRELRGSQYVIVSIVRPGGLAAPIDPQAANEETHDTVKPSLKAVAKLSTWEDCPKASHCALSTALCSSLGAEKVVGEIIRVEAAPQAKTGVKMLKIYPISSGNKADGLQFGGETNTEREEAARKIKTTFASVIEGPLTDGMVLAHSSPGEFEGVIKFEPPEKNFCWTMGSKIAIEVQAEIPRPATLTKLRSFTVGEALPSTPPLLVGVDNLISQANSHLEHSSSVLLTGGQGAGKTSLAQLIAYNLYHKSLYHVTYFSCRKLVAEEVRVSHVKDTLSRIFLGASWGARLGGKAIVVLDDIDKLCPVETELQVGGENGRSRQLSEGVCSIVRQYCGSNVVLLATAQGKESLNNVVVGGHVFREIVTIKAPDKERRRRTLEMLVQKAPEKDDSKVWMDGSASPSTPGSVASEGFSVDPTIDFLDVAGHTDGYMPGDLVVVVARARSEALVRVIEQSDEPSLVLTAADFTKALEGFTPASLRNVTLQSSTTTFASIGGLKETRQILLETLQYPTTYAPIFAQCPLRLRSGLLLYGYPGCGKTMLASAVAGECGLNFISVKGPEILNKYIGASEKAVRDLFDRAEAAKPCVLFFDEFDSVAPKR